MDFEKKILNFTLDLYENPNLSRNDVQFVITLVENFITEIYNPLLLLKLSESLYKAVSEEVSQEIQKIFQNLRNPFLALNTEDKRLRRYKKLGLYTEPVLSPVATICRSIPCGNNKVRIVEDTVEVAYIPIKNSIRQIFNIDGLLEATIAYQNELENEANLSNFVQGSLWKDQVSLWRKQVKHNNENIIVLPFFAHVDDVETGNALGAHSGFNEVGALYGTSPCFPPSFRSKLESIILCQLFYTNDRKKYGNEIIFSGFIDEMNNLYDNGIEIFVRNKRYILYFILSLVLGDNLGMNSISGFIESFSATHFCRICYASGDEARFMTCENKELLRTIEKYEQDVLNIETQTSGIKEKCVFNKVKSYHILKNSAVDIMHDLFEGICMYVICFIILQFVLVDQFFSIDYLNYRLKTMEFGVESSNVPPQINLDYLKKNGKLKMSASECLCFARYLGALIGDKIPRGNKTWALYIKLRELIHLLTAPVQTTTNILKLEMLIPQHHQAYLAFGNELKAKFHFFVHYIRQTLQNGPVINFSSMRFESKHQVIKKFASQSSSHINILKTICKRLSLTSMKNSCKKFKEIDIIYGKDLENIAIYQLFPKSKLAKELSCITLNNFVYKKDTIIITNIDDSGIEFGKIKNVFYVDDTILFDYIPYIEVGFDRHVFGHSVFEINEIRSIKYNDLPATTPCLLFTCMGKMYISTRNVL